MTYDLIVAGAGPAGLFCAIQAATAGLKVCVLEKNASAGKKLLISGSGRCNLTNMAPIGDFPARYGDASRFVAPALRNFTNLDLIEYFAGLGVPLVEMNDGKVFPKSQKAREILDALLSDAARHGVEFFYGSPIVEVVVEAGTFRTRVGATQSDNVTQSDGATISNDATQPSDTPATREFVSRNLLIATGGKSYPITGSTGCGHRIAKHHGHTITETAPALAPLIVKEYKFADCAGISIGSAEIRITRGGKTVRDARGDVLFTHKGLSGPGILDASRHVRKGDVVLIGLTPGHSPEAIEGEFLLAAETSGSRAAKTFLTALGIPERLALAALSFCGVDGALPLARIGRDARKKLCSGVTGLPFEIAELGGFSEAMATRGGIALSEVNPKTMESKILPGLYFAGEALDVDGDTGGFNIQFAFSSGKIAADAMAKKR